VGNQIHTLIDPVFGEDGSGDRSKTLDRSNSQPSNISVSFHIHKHKTLITLRTSVRTFSFQSGWPATNKQLSECIAQLLSREFLNFDGTTRLNYSPCSLFVLR